MVRMAGWGECMDLSTRSKHAAPFRAEAILAPGTGRNRLFGALANLTIANQFLLAASVVVFGLMGLLGFFTAAEVERSALDAAGAAGAARMQIAIAPLIPKDRALLFDETFRKNVGQLVGQGPEGQRIHNLKIWLADGTPVFSALDPERGERGMFDELASALRGEVVVSRTFVDKHSYTDQEREGSFLEIYAPLVIGNDGVVALAGEIYLESGKLEAMISHSRAMTMLMVLLVSVPMLSLLYLIVRRSSHVIDEQRKTLRQSLRNAIDLSIENNRLRVIADNARVEAGKLNERILDQIGADLHDGSVQVLTLVKLRLSDLITTNGLQPGAHNSLQKAVDLMSGALEELRNIAAGLILPELENVTVHEAIEHAMKRYLEITGCEVLLEAEHPLTLRSHDLSICLYRFVLEGLMNSYRHARGNCQRVRYTLRRGRLHVSVADYGIRPEIVGSKERQRVRLGKVSQNRRIRSFGGRMRYMPRQNGSTFIAVLPIIAD